MVKVLETHHL